MGDVLAEGANQTQSNMVRSICSLRTMGRTAMFQSVSDCDTDNTPG